MRIAILGTFDLQNYGDLLFPLLAEHELSRRLDDLEILPFSYRAKRRSDWYYEVYSVTEFPEKLAKIDAILVGGGHVVRFDHALAPEYGPPSPDIHHPTGLWLVPPLLGAAAGRPVAWNAIGASPDLEDWGIGLFRTTLEASAYVSARDSASRATLTAVSDRIEVSVVPDSAFAIADLLQERAAEEDFADWKEARGVREPYVVVQPSPKLEPILETLLPELDHLHDQGIQIVELPIGPVLEDRAGWLAPDWDHVVRTDPWPHPLLLGQIIAHAEASIGVSLHLGITSLCHGVPIHRTRCWPGSKYQILGDFPGVHQFDENGREPRPSLRGKVGRSEVTAEVKKQQQALARHWDRVAEALQAPPGSQPTAVGRFFFQLPFALIEGKAAQLEVEALQAKTEEAERALEEKEQQTLEELRRIRQENELRLSRETALRQEIEQREDRLHAELSKLCSSLAEMAPLLRQSEESRAALEDTLGGIYRSRAWRTSLVLRKLYRIITSPWRGLRRALGSEAHSDALDEQ